MRGEVFLYKKKTLAKENHQIQSFLVDEYDFHGYYNF